MEPGPLEHFRDAVAARAREAGAGFVLDHGLLARPIRRRLAGCSGFGEIEAAARANAARNLFLIERFRQVVATLGDVPVCPLKGIRLLATVYRDELEARVLGDLDLLVPEDAVSSAIDRLQRGLGLEETALSVRLAGRTHDRLVADDRLLVELHTRLGLRHGRASAWGDVRPEPAVVHGCHVFVMSREMELVHLVTHLVKHGPFARLGWVEDVLRLTPEVSGRNALLAARSIRAECSFVAGLRAVGWLAGTRLLEEADAAARPRALRRVRWHERTVWRGLRRAPLAKPPPGRWSRAVTDLLLADSFADSIRVLRARLGQLE